MRHSLSITPDSSNNKLYMNTILTKKRKSIKSSDSDMDWFRFLYTADEFIISYAVTPPILMIKLFLVGHAAELYLKAVFTKQTGNIDQAISYKHRIKDLFVQCQKNDKLFLSDFDYNKLESDEEYRRDKHLELYYVGKYMSELKYLGATFSDMNDLQRYGPNYEWADFFKRIRLYLKYPPKGYKDCLSKYIDSLSPSDQNKDYLKRILV